VFFAVQIFALSSQGLICQQNMIQSGNYCLVRALRSNEAEMVAVIDRRRVGKTFLIRSVCADYLRFETTGVQHASRKEQLKNFSKQLRKSFGEAVPDTPLNS
jgi:hypothetical protein